MNKSQRQRIIVFVGHPISNGTEEDFEDLGMRLKKNNVAIDVINFANPDNIGRLQAMVDMANDGSDDSSTSHFFDVPMGCNSITELLITSPILAMEPEPMAAGGDPAAAGGEVDPLIAMGINPDLDPELAMAIRMSLEEAKQAENAANAAHN